MQSNEGVIYLEGEPPKVVGDHRTGSGIDPMTAWINQPIDPQSVMDQKVLGHVLQNMQQNMEHAPIEELQEVALRQQIAQHNAEIDQAKGKKKQLRQIAKQARMPVEAVKRMIGSVRRVR